MPEIFVAPKIIKVKKEETKKPTNLNIKASNNVGVFDQVKTAFSAFVSLPKDIHFENQEDGEEVILLLRRHWITNFPWLFFSFFGIFAPIIIFPGISFLKISLPLRFQTVGFVSWYILIFTFLFTSFLSWYFNVYIVTNRRLIDVDFFNLLYKEISACPIFRIQDITYKVGGTIGIIFDFGTVFIQTAGAEENIEFEFIPKPAAVVRKITELMKKARPSQP